MSQNFPHFLKSPAEEFGDIMHIDARDLSPPLRFCCIIEYTPYFECQGLLFLKLKIERFGSDGSIFHENGT